MPWTAKFSSANKYYTQLFHQLTGINIIRESHAFRIRNNAFFMLQKNFENDANFMQNTKLIIEWDKKWNNNICLNL